MKSIYSLVAVVFALILVGCASQPRTYTGKDGATYREDKDIQGVWLAEGFDFNGYDTVYVAETAATAESRNDEERQVLATAQRTLRQELANALQDTGLFQKVVLSANDIPPGAKVLRLDNEIYHHEKGGGAARYFVGLYGGGQPIIKVAGRMTATDQVLFRYLMDRSGESGGARMGGAFMKDEDIQSQDIRDLARDLATFISQTAKKLPRT